MEKKETNRNILFQHLNNVSHNGTLGLQDHQNWNTSPGTFSGVRDLDHQQADRGAHLLEELGI